VLGVPTAADRIAQTVVARRLEAKVEPIFHRDPYGYRPARAALDAEDYDMSTRVRCLGLASHGPLSFASSAIGVDPARATSTARRWNSAG